MGKTADNEKLKLRAAFFNNVAVAFFITGVVVPYLSLAYKIGEYSSNPALHGLGYFEILKGSLTRPNVGFFFLLVGVALTSCIYALLFRRWANEELDRLVD
jgi:hypothetical protein